MPALTLPIGSAISIDGYALTEHNRRPIVIDFQQIEQVKRMATGLMRKFHIGVKRTISVSWEMVPSNSTMTVDGKYGATQIRSLYTSGQNGVTVTLTYNTGSTETFVCFFTTANFELVKRNVKANSDSTAQEFWNVSITLEEQ